MYKRQEVHDQQGVGIGLYLAREIVTRQGGYIKAVSYTHLDVYKRQVMWK